MKDEDKRRAYDFIYPSITRGHPSSPQATPQTSRAPHASTPQAGPLSEAAQIAALRKAERERSARWLTRQKAFDALILDIQKDVRRLEQEIKNLESIVAAERAEEAYKNSWGAWLLSPIYKKAEDSDDEKARKDRERQERRIEKDMKERRLESKMADLKKEQGLLKKAKEEVDAADLADDRKLRVIEDTIRIREMRERQAKENLERERAAKIWQEQQEQWEKRNREAAEALRKRQEEERAATQKRQEEEARKRQHFFHDEQYPFAARTSTYQASRILCDHDGWWPKVQGVQHARSATMFGRICSSALVVR